MDSEAQLSAASKTSRQYKFGIFLFTSMIQKHNKTYQSKYSSKYCNILIWRSGLGQKIGLQTVTKSKISYLLCAPLDHWKTEKLQKWLKSVNI